MMAAASAASLVMQDIIAGYLSDVPIVSGFSAEFAPARVTMLIGPNGAGKSTLLRTIFGLTKLFGGRIVFDNIEIQQIDPWARATVGIGFVPQGRSNFPRMSVHENLQVSMQRLARRQRSDATEYVLGLFPVLRERWTSLAGNLSGGQQQMLEMAMALALRPRLLLLDEPSLGLSPLMQQDLFGLIRRLADDGLTVVMVEQHVQAGLLAAHDVIVMEQGTKIIAGAAHDLMQDDRLKRAYLGAPIESEV
jgi:branched-chain amino acid transport system ATP-binding protein